MGTPWVSFNGKDCSGCKHLNDRGYCEFTACIIPCTVGATIPESKPQTKADQLRTMSDEELAEWASIVENNAAATNKGWLPSKWLEWLKREVE